MGKLQLKDAEVAMFQVDLYFQNMEKENGEKLHIVLDVLAVEIAGKYKIAETDYDDQFLLTETVVNEEKKY